MIKTVTETTHQIVHSVEATADNLKRTLNASTEQAKASLETTVQQATQLDDVASKAVKDALQSAFQEWIASHPALFWLISHPIVAFGVAIALIFVLWGFLKAIARFFEQAWVATLQSPFKLGRLLISRTLTTAQTAWTHSKVTHTPSDPDQARLAEILQRLEAIRHEQDELLKEAELIMRTHQRS